MTVYKPVFMRPIEITTANNTFTIELDVGAGQQAFAINLDTGVWGSVFNLAAGIAAEITALHANISCTSSMVQSGDDLLIRFVLVDSGSSGLTPETTWNEVYDIIGATGSGDNDEVWTESPADTYTCTMTYRPTHMWIPTYQSADQGRFYIEQGEIFEGNMSKGGFLAGNQTGPVIYWRDLSFVNEPAENIFMSAATSARYGNRNLETFVKECRSSNPSVSGNGCTRGFYFIPDWNDVTTTCANTHTDNGGINFDYASSEDTFVFCQMNSKGYSLPQSSLPTTKTRYSTGFQIHTVDYSVSWTYYA